MASESSTTPTTVDMLKKPEFIDRVMARVDVKKRDAKPAVEAALAVLAEALTDGEDVNIPPMGKVRVVRSKNLDDGAQVLTLKMRTPKNATKAAKTDVATSDDDA